MTNINNQEQLQHVLRKFKWLVQSESDVVLTPLDVIALLHLIEPQGVGLDDPFRLATLAGVTRNDAVRSLDKLRQMTMSIPNQYKPKTGRPRTSARVMTSTSAYSSISLTELDLKRVSASRP